LVPIPVGEVPNETYKAAADLVTRAKKRRYANVKIVLSHSGGSTPFLASRVACLAHYQGGELSPEEMIADFRSFYYETALSGFETNLVALENFVNPDHILFGSDFPAVDLATAAWYTRNVDAYFADRPEQLEAVMRSNALALFASAAPLCSRLTPRSLGRRLTLRTPNQSHVRTRPRGSRKLEMHAQMASVDGDARSLCEQLLARHHNNVDRGRATSSVRLFAPDAELTVPGGVARGAGEIGTMLQQRERDAERCTLHAITGFDFSCTSPREAAAEGGIALYVGSAERMETVPQSLLRFQAAFRCDDGGWRIASLHLETLGAEGR
jgi:hypothetical protein